MYIQASPPSVVALSLFVSRLILLNLIARRKFLQFNGSRNPFLLLIDQLDRDWAVYDDGLRVNPSPNFPDHARLG